MDTKDVENIVIAEIPCARLRKAVAGLDRKESRNDKGNKSHSRQIISGCKLAL